MTTDPPAPVHAPVSDRDRMVIYLSILPALFLAALDQTIVATARERNCRSCRLSTTQEVALLIFEAVEELLTVEWH